MTGVQNDLYESMSSVTQMHLRFFKRTIHIYKKNFPFISALFVLE